MNFSAQMHHHTYARVAAFLATPTIKKLRKLQSTPQVASSSKEEIIELPLGTKVEHQRFGKGVVTLLEGSGNDKKATIKFNGTGEKKLLLRFAKLKIIN